MSYSRILLRLALLGGARFDNWRARDAERQKRASSGYTSLRVSKATRRELDGLLQRVRVTHPGWKGRGTWDARHLGLDELLYAVARADVKALEDPPRHGHAGKHAKADVGKSMQRGDRETACSDSGRGDCMQFTDPAQLDALEAIA